MKRIFLFYLFLTASAGFSQEVVSWEANYDAKNSEIIIQAKIEAGWHLYSQFIDNSVGPVPTSFSFKSSDNYQLIGRVEEPTPIKKYDESFEATLDFFEKEVDFKQKIKVLNASTLETTVTFMVCNDQKCLPPSDKKIQINLKK